MQRRLMITAAILIAVSAVAVIAGVVSSARGAGPPALRPWGLQPGASVPAAQGIHHPGTLLLTLTSQQQTQIDNDPSGTSQGDEIIVTGPLSREGKPVGVLDAHGVMTMVGQQSERIQYTFTVSLPEGQITSIGVLRLSRNVTGFRGAVVGGTLRYRNARGQVWLTFGQNGSTQFTYQLIP